MRDTSGWPSRRRPATARRLGRTSPPRCSSTSTSWSRIWPRPGNGRWRWAPRSSPTSRAAPTSRCTPTPPGTLSASASAEIAGPGRASLRGMPDEEPKKEQPQKPDPVDDLVTTAHTLRIGDRELAYTATAGRIVLRQEVTTDDAFEGHKPKAEVFLTAYTLNGADPARRPVTFAFNGGPGSSSVWLHLGLLGPRRVLSGDVDAPQPPPYRLVDNAETLLAHSDLVFIDPVSTGFSRALTGEKPGDFHGYQGDIESVGEVIRLWVSRNGRWMSPKFLAGESYGTTRAGGLALHLQNRYGMYLNGLVLISVAMDFSVLDFSEGNDVPYVMFLPTYAAIAHYHGLHGDRPLADVLAEAEEYAAGDYPAALARGSRLSTAD